MQGSSFMSSDGFIYLIRVWVEYSSPWDANYGLISIFGIQNQRFLTCKHGSDLEEGSGLIINPLPDTQCGRFLVVFVVDIFHENKKASCTKDCERSFYSQQKCFQTFFFRQQNQRHYCCLLVLKNEILISNVVTCDNEIF
jgi:hypothetical protein